MEKLRKGEGLRKDSEDPALLNNIYDPDDGPKNEKSNKRRQQELDRKKNKDFKDNLGSDKKKTKNADKGLLLDTSVCETVRSCYRIVQNNTHSIKTTQVELMLNFELTKDIPYFTLTGELWGIYCEYFREYMYWPCKNRTVPFQATCIKIASDFML